MVPGLAVSPGGTFEKLKEEAK